MKEPEADFGGVRISFTTRPQTASGACIYMPCAASKLLILAASMASLPRPLVGIADGCDLVRVDDSGSILNVDSADAEQRGSGIGATNFQSNAAIFCAYFAPQRRSRDILSNSVTRNEVWHASLTQPVILATLQTSSVKIMVAVRSAACFAPLARPVSTTSLRRTA